MARRGRETLAYGPMKPVGLEDPRTGRPRGRPAAAGGSRGHALEPRRLPDEASGRGAEADLPHAARARRRSSPASARSPQHLHQCPYPARRSSQLKALPGVHLAGQMAGVEGYVESAALGYLVGVDVARERLGLPRVVPPAETAHGALLRHLQNADAKHFQPMNVNYGLFPALPREVLQPPKPGGGRGKKLPKREKNQNRGARGSITSLSSRRRCPPEPGTSHELEPGGGRLRAAPRHRARARRIRAARTSPTCAS